MNRHPPSSHTTGLLTALSAGLHRPLGQVPQGLSSGPGPRPGPPHGPLFAGWELRTLRGGGASQNAGLAFDLSEDVLSAEGHVVQPREGLGVWPRSPLGGMGPSLLGENGWGGPGSQLEA